MSGLAALEAAGALRVLELAFGIDLNGGVVDLASIVMPDGRTVFVQLDRIDEFLRSGRDAL